MKNLLSVLYVGLVLIVGCSFEGSKPRAIGPSVVRGAVQQPACQENYQTARYPLVYAVQGVEMTPAALNLCHPAGSFVLTTNLLPEGLSFDKKTGIISGTPRHAHALDGFGIRANFLSDSGPSYQHDYFISIQVLDNPDGDLSRVEIAYVQYDGSLSYRVGEPILRTPIVYGGKATSFTSVLPLPPGLSLNPRTGELSGTLNTYLDAELTILVSNEVTRRYESFQLFPENDLRPSHFSYRLQFIDRPVTSRWREMPVFGPKGRSIISSRKRRVPSEARDLTKIGRDCDKILRFAQDIYGPVSPDVIHWELAPGSDPMPDGFVLDSVTGTISGTPYVEIPVRLIVRARNLVAFRDEVVNLYLHDWPNDLLPSSRNQFVWKHTTRQVPWCNVVVAATAINLTTG